MPLPILAAAALLVGGDLYRIGGYRVVGKPWFDSALPRLRTERLVRGLDRPNLPTDRPRPMGRYEAAVVFHAALTSHLALAETSRARLPGLAPLLPFYRKAAVEYRRELDALGIGTELGIDALSRATRAARADLARRPGPFPDVPSDHWAAETVGALRDLGLLHGGADARFRG